MVIVRRMVLRFPRQLVDQPIVCRLVKEYDLDFNILKAQVMPREEGLLVLELSGPEGRLGAALDFLEDAGVRVEPLSRDIVRIDEKCTHCGACTAVCPAGALAIERDTMAVIFDSALCIACEHCIGACPMGAMETHFQPAAPDALRRRQGRKSWDV